MAKDQQADPLKQGKYFLVNKILENIILRKNYDYLYLHIFN